MPITTKPGAASATTNGESERVDLLKRDSEFRMLLPAHISENGDSALWATALKLGRGAWQPNGSEPSGDHLGFLVLDGLIGRRVVLPDRGRSLELLGRSDLFRPWQENGTSFSRVSWAVIEPATVAALDDSFTSRARSHPKLLEALTERALRRSRRLAVSSAISNTVGVEERVLLALWQLTELWGRKAPAGALLPFRLSHQTIADLVGARRPTVTLALRGLTQRELLRREDSGEWVLCGAPP
jgi:CRP/FNR family transcriptional regulator, cyclic AMP receptor protein